MHCSPSCETSKGKLSMKIKNFLKWFREGLRDLEKSYRLFCLEAKLRSMETREARMFRIWTEDIEAISSDVRR